MEPQLYSQPQSEYDIHDVSESTGVLDQTPILSLDLEDKFIIHNLNNAIEKSREYWNDPKEFNLKTKRQKNNQMLEGRHLADHKLYRHQTPFIDNELFVGCDAIVAYIAARAPEAEAYPGSEQPESKTYAKHLENYLLAHSKKFYVEEKLEHSAWDSLEGYVGWIKLEWDKDYGKDGEIIPRVIAPEHIIVDHIADKDQEPRFICEVKTDTVEGLISQFPDKEQDILELLAIQRKGTQNMTAEVIYREVWFSYFDDDYERMEGTAWYISNLVLAKEKNRNWRYSGSNFMDMPTKPFIPVWLGKGRKWIDRTNSLEQAIPQQDILNKLGRQVIDNLAGANGTKAIDNKAMTKDDAQNWTGDPNQSLLLNIPPGKSIRDVIEQLPPQMVSVELIGEVKNCIERIHGILGTPSQFRGDDTDETRTASEALMIKNQSSGRQDRLVRALDRAMDRYYQLLTQMIVVWYTRKHELTINGDDGNFDFVEMHRDKVEDGCMVKVRTGTSLPFDKARQEAVAQQAAEAGLLSPLDYYRMMHMDNPQKLYDNWVKFKTNPQELAMDALNETVDEKALMDFTALMDGQKVEQREDITGEYIEQFRRLMITDKYLKAKNRDQMAVIKFVAKAADNLALRVELEEMTAVQPPKQPPMPVQVLATGLEQMPPMGAQMPPMQPGLPGMGQPGIPPMGQPGMPPPGPGAAMPGTSPIQGVLQGAGAAPASAPMAGQSQPTVQPGQIPPF